MPNKKFNSREFINALRECDWGEGNKENVNEHEPNSGDITISPELMAQLLQASSEDAPNEEAIDAAMQTMSGIMGQENRTLDSSDLANILTGGEADGQADGQGGDMGGGNPMDSGGDMGGDEGGDDGGMEEEAYSAGDGEKAGDEGGEEHEGRQKLMADEDEGSDEGDDGFDSDPMGSNKRTNEDSMRDYHEDEHAKAEEEWRNRPRFGGSLEDSPNGGNDGFEDEGDDEPMEGSPESKHRNRARRDYDDKERELGNRGESKKGRFPKRTWKNRPHKTDKDRVDESWISPIPSVSLGSQGKSFQNSMEKLMALSGIPKEKASKKDVVQEAYDLGKASFKNGLPEINNPYTEFRNNERLAWRQGWKDGKKGK